MEEVDALKQEWMEQEMEIERLRLELKRAKSELLKAAKGRDGSEAVQGEGKGWKWSEEEDLQTLWTCYGL